MSANDPRVPIDEVIAMFASFANLPDEEDRAPRRGFSLEEIERQLAKHEERRLIEEAEAWNRRMKPRLPGDSPIETLLIQAIDKLSTGNCSGHPDLDGTPLFRVGPWSGYWQLSIGPYFADIAFVLSEADPGVVVECDGHDYHERTKEQAEHDRRRDRWMQAKGWCVLRFTGSEIRRDPVACAFEVLDFLRAKRDWA